MKHQFCIGGCQEPLLNQFYFDTITERGTMNSTDTILLGNTILVMAKPRVERDRELILGRFEIAIEIHEVPSVALFNHMRCGAYRKRGIISDSTSRTDEIKILKDDLFVSEQLLRKRFGNHFSLEMKILDQRENEPWRPIWTRTTEGGFAIQRMSTKAFAA